MERCASRASAALLVLLLLPSASYAQAAITGVVKDASGGVLPGATVEAASPVLIEKVRSVVSDDTGQYRIVSLRPGTYSVTFSLPGFGTVKRDGVELTGTFVATVNGELKVGALEETITVTGETPVVDVQSARVQQTISNDILAAIPSSRNANGIQALIPGMSTAGDFGGIAGGTGGSAGTIHGGRGNDSRTYNDGLNTGFAGGAGGGGNMANVAGAQEVVLSTSGGLGEAETSGVLMNVIPRDGSNTFSGVFFASGANGAMQGSNYTQALKDQGLRTPSELLKVYDINPMGGGRLIQDKLWFYLTYRQWGTENTVPGMWVNRNAGNPNAWTTDFDESQQAFTDNKQLNGIARITWQATRRNKFTVHWSEQHNTSNTLGGGSATQTIEASVRSRFGPPSRIQQASWSSPFSNRVLLEAGFGTYQARYHSEPRIDGTFNPLMIRVQEQGGRIPGLFFRNPGAKGGGFSSNLIGTNEWRASASYVTGAHNMKFGYQGAFNMPSDEFYNFGPINAYRFSEGVPNRLSQTITYPGTLKFARNLLSMNFYAQDQWTGGRLTLQGGLRYDHFGTSYPETGVGGAAYLLAPREIRYASRSTPGIDWHDVTPRMGAAYDLFGNGKTALKFNLGKYMEAFDGGDSDLNLHPLIRTTTSTTRSWTDSNRDFVPNCDLASSVKNGECGPMDDQNFGKEVFTRFYDPSFISGSGNRYYSWTMGMSVQQELAPRVSVTVGYFRNWWGNWYVVDNQATNLADYTPFSIKAPVDARLPDGGGKTVGGLYNLIPGKVGQVNELAQPARNIGEQNENWQGVDANLVARLRSGITLQGGTSTGRRLADSCEIRAKLPELGTGPTGLANSSITASSVTNPYCRVVEPFLTQVRGLVTYTIPKIDLQVSGTWSSTPGPALAANYVANNAVIAGGPQPLGRDLSGSSNVTVNLVAPGTLYADRRTNLDFRVAKILRYGRTRSQIGLDIYNLTNTDVVTTYNQTFVPGGAWLTPTGIQPARYVRLSLQMDF
jgi:hypothetical protein